jgi:transcription antitermination factor NusG
MTKLTADDPRDPREASKKQAAGINGAAGRGKGARPAKAGRVAAPALPPPPPPAPPPFERGAQVRVLRGPFAGKTGIVQDLVGRKVAKILLGLLPVQVDVDDLVPSGAERARPRLTSSHRKPVPARS